MRKKIIRSVIAAGLVISLSACANKTPRPDAEIALAQSAMQSAEVSGAKEYAPIELRIAREKQVAAEKALKREKYFKARYLAVEARVDAELARAAADTEKTRRELAREQDTIGVLPVIDRSTDNAE